MGDVAGGASDDESEIYTPSALGTVRLVKFNDSDVIAAIKRAVVRNFASSGTVYILDTISWNDDAFKAGVSKDYNTVASHFDYNQKYSTREWSIARR